MKKLLLSTITILILILTGITIIKGVTIGKLDILGINDIKAKNDQLDEKIRQATKLASTDYQKKIDSLNENIKKLEAEKIRYEDMVNVSTESEVKIANQSYDYKIDFLWIRIENHAKSEGVKMKMELTRSSSGAENVYNLNFTATGPYIGIEEFITDIEDDSKLGFKIEEFKMTAESEENSNIVQATFICKDVSIEGISSSLVDEKVTENVKTDNKTDTNTDTNTNTNVNSTTNLTNNDTVEQKEVVKDD